MKYNDLLKKKLHNMLVNQFGNDFIGIRGWFWYPPKGFREWHTNMYDPSGWRLYIVHVDQKNKSGNKSGTTINGNKSGTTRAPIEKI